MLANPNECFTITTNALSSIRISCDADAYENVAKTLRICFLMLVSHCGEYPCECKKKIFAANSPDSGEYMADGLTNAIRHQFAMIAK